MRKERRQIQEALLILENNLDKIARINEWAHEMGYENSKVFSRYFLRHFKERPSKIMKRVRLKSIIKYLSEEDYKCFEIAILHSMPDAKALNNYLKRHTRFSPSQIRELSQKEIGNVMEKLGSKLEE